MAISLRGASLVWVECETVARPAAHHKHRQPTKQTIATSLTELLSCAHTRAAELALRFVAYQTDGCGQDTIPSLSRSTFRFLGTGAGSTRFVSHVIAGRLTVDDKTLPCVCSLAAVFRITPNSMPTTPNPGTCRRSGESNLDQPVASGNPAEHA